MSIPGSKSYTDILDMRHIPFSSVSAATTDGMNAIYNFLSEGRSRKGPLAAQIGRTSTVKAEDPAFMTELKARLMGLTATEMTYVNDLLLPTIVTDKTQFKWKSTQYVPGVMVANPAFGVNETNQKIETVEEAIIRRRGQHYIMDEETFYTEEGQRAFQLEMQYWAVSWAETMALEAWAEIISPRIETRRTYFTRLQNQFTFNQAVFKQRDDMFSSYKNPNGIYPFIHEQCQYVHRVCGRPVTIMVMPAEKSGLITNGTSMSSFKKAGERGVDLMISRGDLTEIVPGVKVAAPPRLAIDPAFASESPIDANIATGSHFLAEFAKADEGPFKKGDCKTKLFVDFEDRWVTLPHLSECLKHSGRFEPVDPSDKSDDAKYTQVLAGNEDEDDPFNGYLIDENEHTMAEWVDAVLAANCRFLVASPFMRYRTQGALFAAAGMHAGFTAISKPLLTKGEDAITQTLKWNMTAWVGAVMVDARCFLFMQNVFFNGILGGSGAQLINSTDAAKLRDVTNWEDNRLNRPSLYFMVIGPKGDVDANYIDLRGKPRFGPDSTYPCSAFYTQHFGFDMIDEGTEEAVAQPIAPICFRRAVNRWNGNEYVYEAGNGVFGKIEGVGCREVREYGVNVPHDIITKC